MTTGMGAEDLEAFSNSSVPEWNEDIGKPTNCELRRIRMFDESVAFGRLLARAVCGRRLFITSGGYIGLGPKVMREDGGICALWGSHVAFVMREQGGGRWVLIGECYVHGIIDGESDRKGWRVRF